MSLIEYTKQFNFQTQEYQDRNQNDALKVHKRLVRAQERMERTDRRWNKLNFGGRLRRALSFTPLGLKFRLFQRLSNKLRGGSYGANPWDEKMRLRKEKVDYLREKRDRILARN